MRNRESRSTVVQCIGRELSFWHQRLRSSDQGRCLPDPPADFPKRPPTSSTELVLKVMSTVPATVPAASNVGVPIGLSGHQLTVAERSRSLRWGTPAIATPIKAPVQSPEIGPVFVFLQSNYTASPHALSH
jgi:hypothetical protein